MRGLHLKVDCTKEVQAGTDEEKEKDSHSGNGGLVSEYATVYEEEEKEGLGKAVSLARLSKELERPLTAVSGGLLITGGSLLRCSGYISGGRNE